MANIYFFRHGQAMLFNSDYDKLSPLGVIQSKRLRKLFKERNILFDEIYSGNLKRQVETSLYAIDDLLKERIVRDKGWDEYNHSEIINKCNPQIIDNITLYQTIFKSENPKLAVQKLFIDSVQRWTSGEYNDYDESYLDFSIRIENTFNQLVSSVEGKKNIAIFTSSGVISIIMKIILKIEVQRALELQYFIANASTTIVKINSHGSFLKTFNDYGYIPKDNISFR